MAEKDDTAEAPPATAEDTELDDTSTSPDVRPLTLEEARRRYDDEEARRENVESKIGIVITIDAIVISLVSVFSSAGWFTAFSLGLALLSAGIGLWTLRTRDYNRPGLPIEDFLQYDGMTAAQQRKQLLFDYIVALDGNEDADDSEDRVIGNQKKNSSKYRYFDVCVLLTGLSLLLILIPPILDPVRTVLCGS